jgi:hypothetical protein
VAVIAPPGDLSGSLMNRIENIANDHNKRQKGLELDIFLTTHVPPYGYGKTHGLTKIIRLVPQPLLLEVTDTLTALLEPGETKDMITWEDVKAAFLMILRLHCRLSHVAAHTAIDSISLFHLVSNATKTAEQLHNFLAPDVGPPEEKKEGEDDLTFAIDDDQSALMDAELSYGNHILTHVQKSAGTTNLMKLLDDVLLEEMNLTKNMTVWPCPSFWAAGELSDITRRLAQALSPNCDDPYVNCFVQRDKCEFHGDAECHVKY